MGAACCQDGNAHGTSAGAGVADCTVCCQNSSTNAPNGTYTMAIPSDALKTPDTLNEVSKRNTTPEVQWQEQDEEAAKDVLVPGLPPPVACAPEPETGDVSPQQCAENTQGENVSPQQCSQKEESGEGSPQEQEYQSPGEGTNSLWSENALPLLELRFIKDDKTQDSYIFKRRPVGLDFYKSHPITVKKVVPGGTADKLGVQTGWTICAVNSIDVTNFAPLETIALVTKLASKLGEDT